MKLKVGDKLKLKPYNESLQLYGINIDDYIELCKNYVIIDKMDKEGESFSVRNCFWCFHIDLIDDKSFELPNHLFEI